MLLLVNMRNHVSSLRFLQPTLRSPEGGQCGAFSGDDTYILCTIYVILYIYIYICTYDVLDFVQAFPPFSKSMASDWWYCGTHKRQNRWMAETYVQMECDMSKEFKGYFPETSRNYVTICVFWLGALTTG